MKFESKDFAMWVMRAAWYLAMLAATVLALLPVEQLQLPIFNWWDKAQHALAFAVSAGWALLLWPGARARVLLGMLAYGGGIELAQCAVGWRFAEWADWAADALGVALGRAGRDRKHERTAA
jgi:hypothetical protein